MEKGKMIIVSAPSGSGKSTIVQWLMKEHPELRLYFSISCTSRPPRGTEQNGVEYFFLSPEEFRERIARNEFLEYEEVYEDRFYGTLKEQVERQREAGQNVVFDVDVKGGCNIKQYYGEEALSLFIQPPSIEELRHRLEGRATDTPEAIEARLAKASYELTFAFLHQLWDLVSLVSQCLAPVDGWVHISGCNKHGCDYQFLDAVCVCTRCVEYYNTFLGALVYRNVVHSGSCSCHCKEGCGKLHIVHLEAPEDDSVRICHLGSSFVLISLKQGKSCQGNLVEGLNLEHISSPLRIYP